MAALQKYNGISKDDYLNMSEDEICEAIKVSQMPQEVADLIWVKERNPFEMW